MGLIGGMARTAVVAGTATAVSNRVSRRQAGRWAAAGAAGSTTPTSSSSTPSRRHAAAAAAAAGAVDDLIEQLEKLGRAARPGHPHRRRVRGTEGEAAGVTPA